jgi:hypothetical protein
MFIVDSVQDMQHPCPFTDTDQVMLEVGLLIGLRVVAEDADRKILHDFTSVSMPSRESDWKVWP